MPSDVVGKPRQGEVRGWLDVVVEGGVEVVVGPSQMESKKNQASPKSRHEAGDFSDYSASRRGVHKLE